ncbi:hypothetical protein [Mitsuokella multacida]|uniref:hypothetical protein n=1 Tax=Mitsuokella multacida TaxID=52226 RepID=UPI0026DD19BF|nr:hypothetical protein [Mitsuokella multacida]
MTFKKGVLGLVGFLAIAGLLGSFSSDDNSSSSSSSKPAVSTSSSSSSSSSTKNNKKQRLPNGIQRKQMQPKMEIGKLLLKK